MNASYRLVVMSGMQKGDIFPLDGEEYLMGRDPSTNFVVSEVEVSRKHARIFRQGPNYLIEDLGSTNGTSVSGQRISHPYILQPGEIITLGEHTNLLFEKILVDPDATIASAAPLPAAPSLESIHQAAREEAAPRPAVRPVPAAPQPVYAPVGEAEEESPAVTSTGKKSRFVTILIILIFLLACGCVAFAIFDALDLYCNFPGIINFFIPNGCPI